ncbi:probable response regulator [Burkholderiales bacterium GJ-E10]|nr:probable response regulator [Burkholderiales bacterium GJ-E10]
MSADSPLVLVVDDDRLVLVTLCAGLRQAGIDVIEADNGDDAILLARQHKPQLAILDMRMQGKSGMDVARYLASLTPPIDFLFLSAFNDSQTVDEAKRLGALGYLVKPLDVQQIVPAVRAALARTQGTRPPVAAPRPAPPPSRDARFDESVAIGILMERLRLDYRRAAEALRAQAQAEGGDVAALATGMVEAANRLNSIPR